MTGPIARILLRYGVGLTVGSQLGDTLAGDPDIVALTALGIGAATEAVYAFAKRRGWTT